MLRKFAAMLPFILFGLATTLTPLDAYLGLSHWLRRGIYWMLASYVLMTLGLGVGWVQGFPRWSYPYLIFVPLFALYWSSLATAGFRFFGHTFRRNELWGWRAWVPVYVMVIVVLLITRSLRPLWQLLKGIWHDWTRLSFALYSLFPLLFWVSVDETSPLHKITVMTACTALLTAGALAYMWGATTQQRVLALLAGVAAAAGVAVTGGAFYWDGRMEPWMRTAPDRWYVAMARGTLAFAIIMALMMAPAVLVLIRRSVKHLRAV